MAELLGCLKMDNFYVNSNFHRFFIMGRKWVSKNVAFSGFESDFHHRVKKMTIASGLIRKFFVNFVCVTKDFSVYTAFSHPSEIQHVVNFLFFLR